METTSPPAPPPDGLPIWHGDRLLSRSLRFAAVLMAPILVGLAIGPGAWIGYAILTGILVFLTDAGGRPGARFTIAGAAGFLVVLGAGLGTLANGHPVGVVLMLAASAFVYGLVESINAMTASAARFFCLALAIGALYAPIHPIDVLVVALTLLWASLISVLWDAATGLWRPSVAPDFRTVLVRLRTTEAERLVFASIVALAVVAAFIAARALGVPHPNWAVLALVIVLRADAGTSRTLIRDLWLGTAGGVIAALVYIAAFDSSEALMIGMAIAALVRWPLQEMRGAFGLGAIAAFIILLLQLVARETGTISHAPAERVLDVSIGCFFAMVALVVNRRAQHWLGRFS